MSAEEGSFQRQVAGLMDARVAAALWAATDAAPPDRLRVGLSDEACLWLRQRLKSAWPEIFGQEPDDPFPF